VRSLDWPQQDRHPAPIRATRLAAFAECRKKVIAEVARGCLLPHEHSSRCARGSTWTGVLPLPVTHSELLQIIVQLYAAISSVSEYGVPQEMPHAHLVPKAVIQDLVCTRPCQIVAFYHPDFGVVVDESLDLSSNLYHRSIVLHELVHHAQHAADRFGSVEGKCAKRALSEREAYEIQNRYLASQGASAPVPTVRWEKFCRTDTE
jgi:hypothetical protein